MNCTLIVTFTSRNGCHSPEALSDLEAIQARAGMNWQLASISLAADRCGLLVLKRRMQYDDAKALMRSMYAQDGELVRIGGDTGGVRAASIRADNEEREPWQEQ